MAVMIMSGSIPFSLASASIVCINGFCIVVAIKYVSHGSSSKFHVQAAARNQVQWQPMYPPLRSFEQHVRVFDPPQPALERVLVVHSLSNDDLCAPPLEALVIGGIPQRPIQPRRRHLKRVRKGERVFHVENRTDLAVDLLAVVDADAFLRGSRRSWSIDDYAYDVTGCLTPALDVPDGQAARSSHPFGDCPDLRQRFHRPK